MAALESSAQHATGISSIKEEYPVHKRNTQYTRRMLSTQEENPAHKRKTLGEPWPLAGLWLLLLPGISGGSGSRAVPGGLAAVGGFPRSRPPVWPPTTAPLCWAPPQAPALHTEPCCAVGCSARSSPESKQRAHPAKVALGYKFWVFLIEISMELNWWCLH